MYLWDCKPNFHVCNVICDCCNAECPFLFSANFLHCSSSCLRSMETFEIKREDDGSSLGRFRARPQGKLVAEVLKNMKKKLGYDGILLDDTTELTDTDLLTPGRIYKFRRSIHVDAPSAPGM